MPVCAGLAKYYFTGPAGECAKQASFFEDKNILSLGFGYVVVVGIGLFFSVFTALLVSDSQKSKLFSAACVLLINKRDQSNW
jgi:hypothetical protein